MWLAASILIAGSLAACTRNSRRQITILIVFPAVATGALVTGLYAFSDPALSIPAYAVVFLIPTAVGAILAPSKQSRIAVLIILPLLGLALFLVTVAYFVSCCAT